MVPKLAVITAGSNKMAEALAAVRKSLRDVVRQNQALGDIYDLIDAKQGALTAGIRTLVSAGFSPFSKEVRGLVLDLQDLNNVFAQTAQLASTPISLIVPKAELPATLKTKDAGKEDSDFKLLTDKEQRFADFTANMKRLTEDLNNSVGPLLADFAGQFGAAFGSIVSGTTSAGDALAGLFGGILQSIGGFMSTFGKQLIAIGIGKLGLDTLFKGAAGGPLAIAAGLGLVALGGVAAAVGKSASSSLSSISGSGGAAPSTRSTFTPTQAPTGGLQAAGAKYEHIVKFEASGNALAAVLAYETDRVGRVVGRR